MASLKTSGFQRFVEKVLAKFITKEDLLKRMTPTSHASTRTTYGVGNSSNYGHVKWFDSTTSTSGVSTGIAATPKAVSV